MIKQNYILKVKENGSTTEEKAIPIEAKTREEALQKAKTTITQNFNPDGIAVYISAPISNSVRMILSFVLMGIAIVVLFRNGYTETVGGLFGTSLFSKEVSVSFVPGFFESMAGLLFYCTYIYRIKGMGNSFKTKFDFLQFLMIVPLVSGLFKMITWRDTFSIFDSKVLIGYCILLCFLSIKPFNVYFTLITMALGLGRISDVSEIMGTWGTVFALCAFLGIVLNISVDPYLCNSLPNLLKSQSMKFEEFKLDAQEVVDDGVEVIGKAAGTIIGSVKESVKSKSENSAPKTDTQEK